MLSACKGPVFAALQSALASPDGELAEQAAAVHGAFKATCAPEPADEADAAKLKEGKEVLELTIRMFMEELLVRSTQKGQSVESVGIPRLLDIVIKMASADNVDTNTPFALLEDLFDTQVISEAENLFGLIEKRAAALTPFLGSESRFMRGKLTLIRTSNELLRRLSKSKNTNFCGRILLFMAYALPLAEKSGLNLKGATAPSTVKFEENEPDEERLVEGGGAAEGSGDVGGEQVNFAFYVTFWGLQRAFSEPAKAIGPDMWDKVHTQLDAVLQVATASLAHPP